MPEQQPPSFPLKLEMGIRANLTDSPSLIWSSQEIAAVLGISMPQQGYWDPDFVILEILTSGVVFDPNQFPGPFSYQFETSTFIDVSNIKAVAFSNPGMSETWNEGDQYFHPLGVFIQERPLIQLGISPLPAVAPTALVDLGSGYYAIRLYGRQDPAIYSNWVFFEFSTY